MDDPLDGRIGEAWSGEVPDGSHINVVLARRGSPTAAAAAGALASPRPGHVPFLACLSPGVVVRPIDDRRQQVADRGRRAGSARSPGAPRSSASRRACSTPSTRGCSTRPRRRRSSCSSRSGSIPAAADETAVKAANRAAMRDAIADALRPPGADAVRALAARREDAANAYYTGA